MLGLGLLPAFAQAPPAVPALPDTERRTSYSLTGTNCTCAVNFAIYGDNADYQDWIEVYVNGVLAPYNDPTFGWTITSLTGPLASIPRPITDAQLTFTNVQTGTVQIVGARRPRRLSQFTENRGVAARDLNQVLTDIIAQNREVWDKINDVSGRALISQPGNVLGQLPLPAACVSSFLGFDSTGLKPICSPFASGGPLVPGATVINPPTNGGVLYDNNGILGDSKTLPSGLTLPNLQGTGAGVFGDTINGPTWVNAQLPGSQGNVPLTAIATTTENWSAFLSATKTSLNTSVGASFLADTCLNYADDIVVGSASLSWCRYSQTVIASGSAYRSAIGEENSINNLNANAGFEDPATINPSPAAINLRLDSGIGVGTPFNLTAALDIVNNNGKYNSGIIIAQSALDISGGYADAIAMGVNEGLSLYSASGVRAVKIFLNSVSAPAAAEQMIFGNNTFDLYLAAGSVHALAITSSTVGLDLPVTITPPSGLNKGLNIAQTISGSPGADIFLNNIVLGIGALSDATHNIYGFGPTCNVTSASFSGQLFCGYTSLNVSVVGTPGFPNDQYIGHFNLAIGSANTTDADASIFGGNDNVQITGTGWAYLVGREIDDTALHALTNKYGLKISQSSVDAFQGSIDDAAILLLNQGGAVGWKKGIEIGAGVISSGGYEIWTPNAAINANGFAEFGTNSLLPSSGVPLLVHAAANVNFTVTNNGGVTAISSINDALGVAEPLEIDAISVALNPVTITLPNVTTGTPSASLCINASNQIIKKTTAGSCV